MFGSRGCGDGRVLGVLLCSAAVVAVGLARADTELAEGPIPLAAAEPVVQDTLAALAGRDGELAKPLLPAGRKSASVP